MTRSLFRPCIDLHDGQVKQIVGGTLSSDTQALKTNFVSPHGADYFAALYRSNGLKGAHVIKLGHNNDEAARCALRAWPHGLQLGGGITLDNAAGWIDEGAHKVIVTSWLFPDAQFSRERLRKMSELVGREALVVDLRKRDDQWVVSMNKWQTPTNMILGPECLSDLGEFASEFLVHAADVEGLCQGVDELLVQHLSDIALVNRLSNGRVDLTYG
eukprot:jgi/Hompol1/5850/HPOL_001021-RA